MTSSLLLRSPSPDPALYPQICEALEEISAAQPADAAAALAFGVSRLGAGRAQDPRPLALVTTAAWVRERGRPFVHGLKAWGVGFEQLVWVRAEREGDALWALEEVLKSGAVAGGLATVEQPPFVTTRRLEFAARAGASVGLLVRAGGAGDLSAARRRWRVSARLSGVDLFHAAAPGAVRLRAELLRRRDGPPHAWNLEQDDETGRLGVAPGLAGDGLDAAVPVPVRSAHAAA
jgi:protein ImuA